MEERPLTPWGSKARRSDRSTLLPLVNADGIMGHQARIDKVASQWTGRAILQVRLSGGKRGGKQ